MTCQGFAGGGFLWGCWAVDRQEASKEHWWQGSRHGRGRGHEEEGRWIHETVQRPKLGRVGPGEMGPLRLSRMI